MHRMSIAAASMIALASVALAGRPVAEEEKAKLVAAVTTQQCSGGKMEFDDGKFEVDNARCNDGKSYDLDFDASFKLISKKLEN